MRLQTKVFFAIFASSALVASFFCWSLEHALRNSLAEEYFARYETLGQVVGNTLRQMEATTARITEVAARALYSREKGEGVLSEESLRSYRSSLAVSQLVITSSDGTIIRDTETPPALRKSKLFDFCEGYRRLLDEPNRIETTPILPSFPSGESYLFSMMARADRGGIVEAGMHVRFVVDTLSRVAAADPNIHSLALFTPRGLPLGAVSPESAAAPAILLEHLAPGRYQESPDRLVVVKEVPAATAECCECKKKGLVGSDGRYFYLLRTEVSLASLAASQALLRQRALLTLIGSLFLAGLVSWLASVRAVARLNRFHRGVRLIGESGQLGKRLDAEGKDEIGSLARSFNRLTERLEQERARVVETEKNLALTEMATKVAHDIRSPLAALKSISHATAGEPTAEQAMLRAAADRVESIAEDLLKNYRGATEGPRRARAVAELIRETVTLKLREHETHFKGEIRVAVGVGAENLSSVVPAALLARSLSNILNNAIEATKFRGKILVTLGQADGFVEIQIADDGPGLPPERIVRLRESGGSFGKPGGTGLGLRQAREMVKACGGEFLIESCEGQGVTITFRLPSALSADDSPEALRLPLDIVLVDDDSSVHAAWENRLRRVNPQVNIFNLYGAGQFRAFAPREGQFFLVDYDLGEGETDGLTLIAEKGIADRSVLVTSHAGDQALRNRCAALGVRILPKDSIATVPLKISQ